MIQPITFAQGKHILDTVPGSTLVDVRTEDEYGAEHAAGAVLLPLEDIEDADLDSILPNKDAPVLLYCRTGRRSALAAAQLFDQGYTRLYDLGGLNGWPYGMEYGLLCPYGIITTNRKSPVYQGFSAIWQGFSSFSKPKNRAAK